MWTPSFIRTSFQRGRGRGTAATRNGSPPPDGPPRRDSLCEIVTEASLRTSSQGVVEIELAAGHLEHDLGDHATRRGAQQEAHRLGYVLGANHRLGVDLALDEVGHRRVDERRA